MTRLKRTINRFIIAGATVTAIVIAPKFIEPVEKEVINHTEVHAEVISKRYMPKEVFYRNYINDPHNINFNTPVEKYITTIKYKDQILDIDNSDVYRITEVGDIVPAVYTEKIDKDTNTKTYVLNIQHINYIQN